MRWLRLVGSLKTQVSFAKQPYKRDDILPKRPIILRSLRTQSHTSLRLKLAPRTERERERAREKRESEREREREREYVHMYKYVCTYIPKVIPASDCNLPHTQREKDYKKERERERRERVIERQNTGESMCVCEYTYAYIHKVIERRREYVCM